MAIDPSGNAYAVGVTYSIDFPTVDAFQASSHGGVGDVFVSELNAAGSALLYSTYLGGTASDGGLAIALDPSGNAYVMGQTASLDFPTTPGALQTVFGGGLGMDAFVSKLILGSPVGTKPVTMASVNGSGDYGWYVGPPTITLTVGAGSSQLSVTYYNLDGGVYHAYAAPFRFRAMASMTCCSTVSTPRVTKNHRMGRPSRLTEHRQ